MCQTNTLLSTTTTPANRCDLAEVFRRYGADYQLTHPLSRQQHKVMRAIQLCRTSELGGHLAQCDHCGKTTPSYNSCRNRHCPQCQFTAKEKWIENRAAELLPAPYFHVVFTLPHSINALANSNPDIIFNLLYQCAWQTIKTLGHEPKRLNGEMGMLAILHTWGQSLSRHVHLHCVIPGGAFNQTQSSWTRSRPNFLFPVKVMSKLFRGLFVTKLRKLFQNKQLKFYGQAQEFANQRDFGALLDQLMTKPWVVYSKKPFAGPKQVLNYLGRYTHKIAIANYRILSCDNKQVRFKWRDYKDKNKVKIMTLSANDFIQRFLQHVLPPGFTRIRQFGFLANCIRNKRLPLIRECLKAIKPTTEKASSDLAQIIFKTMGIDINKCPHCGVGTLLITSVVPRPNDTRNNVFWDTS